MGNKFYILSYLDSLSSLSIKTHNYENPFLGLLEVNDIKSPPISKFISILLPSDLKTVNGKNTTFS